MAVQTAWKMSSLNGRSNMGLHVMQIFRISFHNNGKVYQLHAERVSQGDLYGFVEVEGLLFGEHTSVVIDPSEERLKDEFAGVSSIQVPMHAVIRVDKVEKRGQNKILELDGSSAKITPFPLPGGPNPK